MAGAGIGGGGTLGVDIETGEIQNGAVTLAKMANLDQDKFIGRTTASTGVPETATITAAARTVLDDATIDAILTTLGIPSGPRQGGSPLTEAASFTTITDTAYWVYVGCSPRARTIAHVEFRVGTGGSGAQTAEVALASSPLSPNKTAQVLTKIAADGTLSDVTVTGVMRNTSSMAASVPAGTHLWAGIRFAMATTQPVLRALTSDWSEGWILTTAAPGALTGAGPWTGALVAEGVTAQGPALRVVSD